MLGTKKYISGMVFKGYGIELRPITPCDLPSLRRWRNNPRINFEMHTTHHITPRQQRLWYEGIKDRIDQAHWVAWSQGVRTGYMKIVGEGPLELQSQVPVYGGLYAGDSSVRHGLLGYAIAMMMLDIIFEQLSVTQFPGTTREDNYHARQFNKQLGYREEGCQDGFVKLTISYSDYIKAKARLIRYFQNDKT